MKNSKYNEMFGSAFKEARKGCGMTSATDVMEALEKHGISRSAGYIYGIEKGEVSPKMDELKALEMECGDAFNAGRLDERAFQLQIGEKLDRDVFGKAFKACRSGEGYSLQDVSDLIMEETGVEISQGRLYNVEVSKAKLDDLTYWAITTALPKIPDFAKLYE